MKPYLPLLGSSLLIANIAQANDLMISGVIDGPLPGGLPKAVEIYAINNIDDLSAYSVGTANNGGGTDGPEFTFPAEPVTAGSYLYVASEDEQFTAYFGMAPNFTSGAMGINGDDAIELFQNDAVIDTFGQIDVDGNDTPWEYVDGWAYRNDGEAPNAGTFDASNWAFSGVDALDGSENNASANPAFPLATFSTDASGGGDEPTPDPEPEPTIELGVCTDDATLIHAIQGTDAASAEAGNGHIIQGVITGKRSDGFFVQEETADADDNDATSEGIFVRGSTDVEVGQSIRLYGEVVENFGMTSIELDDTVAALDCGTSDIPDAVALALPYEIDPETLEGMRVTVTDTVVTSTDVMWRFGDVLVSDGLKWQPTDIAVPGSDAYNAAVENATANLLIIEDNTTAREPATLSFFPEFGYNNSIRIGDKISATGPLNYSFGNYRVNPETAITLESSRQANPELEYGNLNVATFNVLNYFNGEQNDDGSVNFDYSANRGAESAEEFALQEARIVAALGALDADVIGLMEVENDGYGEDSSIQSLVTALNAGLAEEDQYTFITTADSTPIGTDAITVGLIYRASAVTPAGDAAVVAMPIQTDGSRLNRGRDVLVQSFTHLESERDFLVAVNHYKSKGGGCMEDSADNPSLATTSQGRCNALRVSASVALGEYLADESLPERKILLGDFNAYSNEDPIAVLTSFDASTRGYDITTAANTELNDGAAVAVTEGFGYHNLAETTEPGGFSYWYHGSEQVGSLDHLLVSDTLQGEVVDGKHWNINSAEAYQLQYNAALEDYPAFAQVGPFRSSDHDPFIASFQLEAEPAPEPTPEPTPEPAQPETSSSSGGSMSWVALCLIPLLFIRRKMSK